MPRKKKKYISSSLCPNSAHLYIIFTESYINKRIMKTKALFIALLLLSALQIRAQVNNVSAFSQKLQEREQKKKEELKILEDLLVQYKSMIPGLVKFKLTVENPIEITKGKIQVTMGIKNKAHKARIPASLMC